MSCLVKLLLFFFNDTATTEIYTLSLHDALPISGEVAPAHAPFDRSAVEGLHDAVEHHRSEEHTSELQSHLNLVCRLVLETKKTTDNKTPPLVFLYTIFIIFRYSPTP